ncbi:hypothetical protein K439DRAFT_724058 [Ramaria rubella]|nr:hypothetical protein K439DRAFT_724058 [Ramaria rubella]
MMFHCSKPDNRHVVHELPRLLREGYAAASGSGSGGEAGNGSSGLKRAMGEVLIMSTVRSHALCTVFEQITFCRVTRMHVTHLHNKAIEITANPDKIT